MTKPKSADLLERNNRRFGDAFRAMMVCPLCDLGPGQIRVVAYRATSVRLECNLCGLRFSIDPATWSDAVNADLSKATMVKAIIERGD